jgi:hypothetical protein
MWLELFVVTFIYLFIYLCTVELHLSGLIGKAGHPVMLKIRIIGFFFFENSLHLQFEFRLLVFTVRNKNVKCSRYGPGCGPEGG